MKILQAIDSRLHFQLRFERKLFRLARAKLVAYMLVLNQEAVFVLRTTPWQFSLFAPLQAKPGDGGGS
jgi:hypothetical protein